MSELVSIDLSLLEGLSLLGSEGNEGMVVVVSGGEDWDNLRKVEGLEVGKGFKLRSE